MIPKAVDIEESVLGLALRDEQACIVMLSEAEAEDFTGGRQKIYFAIKKLFSENAPVNVATLTNQIKEAGITSEVGGESIAEILHDKAKTVKPSGASVACGYLKKYTKRRKLIDLCAEYNDKARDRNEDTEELLASAGAKFFDLLSDNEGSDDLSYEQMIDKHFERIQQPIEHGIKTGLDVDKITFGFKPKQLVIIAGKTSHGKSAFVQNIMLTCAENHGHVGFISMEMGEDEIMERIFAMYSGVSKTSISQRNIAPDDLKDLMKKTGMLKDFEYQFQIVGKGDVSIDMVRATARKMKIQHGTKMLIIDYLQQVAADGDSREQEVAKVSRGLKSIAMDLGIVVIALSQFNRKSSMQDRPQLHQLRESGAIEQDANTVILMWNPSVDGKERFDNTDAEGKWAGKSTHNIVELHVAKNRGGRTGTVKVGFDGSIQRFYNLAPEPNDAMDFLK